MDNKYSRSAQKDYSKVAAEKLRVSFEYLDLSLPHFFVHGLIAEHYRKIFDCFNELSSTTEDQIVEQKHPSLTPKSIFNTDSGEYSRFPEELDGIIAKRILGDSKAKAQSNNGNSGNAVYALTEEEAKVQAKSVVKRAFEVRIGKGYGRIHGIVWDKVFYVIWFDPAHNLYPDEKFGGVKLHQDFAKVKSFAPETVIELRETHAKHCEALQAKLEQLQIDNDELLTMVFTKETAEN